MITRLIRQVGIVGAGTMGRGIAQVFSQSGRKVILYDSVASQLLDAVQIIASSLDRQVKKGQLESRQKETYLQNIESVAGLEQLSPSDFVVEAVAENLALKQEIFYQLGNLCREEVILSSNTSSISITQLGVASGRPDRTVGMHFMNPVPLMKLVEIVRGRGTSEETLLVTREIATSLEKLSVDVNDSPGFVSNRVLMPMINEAIFCVYEGVGVVKSIDLVMKIGMNHPLGPLALADLIGLDVCLDIMETLYDGFNDTKYRPCPLLKKMVSEGRMGKKSGQGFYAYI